MGKKSTCQAAKKGGTWSHLDKPEINLFFFFLQSLWLCKKAVHLCIRRAGCSGSLLACSQQNFSHPCMKTER